MRFSVTLSSISYSGWSTGRDIRVDITVGGDTSVVEKRMRPISFVRMEMGLGVFEADATPFEMPIRIRVTEKDRIYPDAGELETILVVGSAETSEVEYAVEVVERRFVFWKAKAIFTFHIVIRPVQETVPEIRKYQAHNGEDYNRYDEIIRDAVAYWNNEFSKDTDPPTELLDPNIVKAMSYQESCVGNYKSGSGLINIMQVGNEGDPSLRVLRGEQIESWIHNGKQIALRYDAKVESQKDSVWWGTRWLYHKAQYIRSEDGRRAWRPWKEAVRHYGPPRKEYSDNVWSIYTKGIDTREKPHVKLWSFVPLLVLLFPSTFNFGAVELIHRDYGRSFHPAPAPHVGPLDVQFAPQDRSLFVATEDYQDWWEDIHVGRFTRGKIRWLPLRENSEHPMESGILSVRFISLKGFNEPLLEVYGMGHRGYGSLHLYRVGESELVPLLEVPAVDIYNDDVWRPGGYPKYGGYPSCGKVYKGDKLDASYDDINGDGIDDVTLSGTAEIICTEQVSGEYDTLEREVVAGEEPVSQTHILSQ
ncbi:MAG: hypothetical protein AAB421_04210 [Patescibacteria group bacterium]